ncbi:MAG: hypothetical protein JST20_14120 [Bacteroidetes bacterium]|nr:hypothetical protein [Bacteroidota bacterium]
MKLSRKQLFISMFTLFFIVSFFRVDAGKNSKKNESITSTSGKFRVTLPNGFVAPKPDSQYIRTDFGETMFYAYLMDSKKSSCMVGYYDYSTDSLKGKDISAVIDTTQMRIIQNMGGTLTRKYKLMRDGLPTRTSYFTTTSRGDTTSYWRFELVFANPRVYQFGFTCTNKKMLEATDTKNFFNSFKVLK